jgi:Tol biopolymer transport system component
LRFLCETGSRKVGVSPEDVFIFTILNRNSMKKLLLLLLLFYISNAHGQSKSYDYCYVKGRGIWVYSMADKKDYMILKSESADNPCISHDGKKVAYTSLSKNRDRTVSVIDLNTKKRTRLKTGSKNCYGPMWSPDGRWIAYNVFDTVKAKWDIAVIDTNNTLPEMVIAKVEDSYSPTWLSDSKHIAVHNLNTIYVFDLFGKIDATYKVSSLAKTLGASSSDSFIFTNDNSKIVFDSSVDEPGIDGEPPNAIFAYDVARKSAIRLTPKGYNLYGIFLKGNHVLFNGGKINSNISNVYSVDLDGKNLKILFVGCRGISASD